MCLVGCLQNSCTLQAIWLPELVNIANGCFGANAMAMLCLQVHTGMFLTGLRD
jgi:hypothetical protein